MMKESIKTIVSEIQEVTDLIYQQNNMLAYQKLAVLLIQLTTITDQIYAIDMQGKLINFDKQKYFSVLTDAMNALEKKDGVLLADILNYDLAVQLEELITQL